MLKIVSLALLKIIDKIYEEIEPELKEFLINELKELVDSVSDYIQSKLDVKDNENG